ncbi:Yippee family putative zinc-binding protein [Prunus dulcis]|uniref:Yippee family putative zinc-binding protein n=1 Tax=Prunus dulcis TaxID=3755 RepID=A0A4Y1QLJ1_PRUDU|nr:Yippee family putative zinc-binding protein [Prunus dulcis]
MEGERRVDHDNTITLLLTYFVFHATKEKSQKYTEGKFILETFHILGLDGSNYFLTLETHIGGSDADDA